MSNIGVRRNALFDSPVAQPQQPAINNNNFPQLQPTPTVNETPNSWFSADPSSAFSNFPQIVNNPAAELVIGYGVDKIYGSSQNIVNNGLGKYFSFLDGLRPYFNVDNSYVLNKLRVLLFPIRHSWEKKNRQSFPSDAFAPQVGDPTVDASAITFQRDINDPDLYIPTMAVVTYVLLVGFLMGTDNSFTPEVLLSTATKAIILTMLEIGLIKLAFYFLNVPTSIAFLDITSYSGYKFVGVVLSIIGALCFGNYAYFPIMIITSAFMFIFMKNTLRRAGLHTSDASNRIAMDDSSNKRNYFILIVALLQIPLSFLLSYPYAKQLVLWSASTAAAAAATVAPAAATAAASVAATVASPAANM